MKHYLITPWNVDNLDPEWLTERHMLFERYCLPSVQSQTNKNFEWILVVDARTPASFKRKLKAYPVEVLYFDFEDFDLKLSESVLKQIRWAAWRGVNIEYAIAAPLRDYIGTLDTDYVITTRLDSDDVIAINHIEKIQGHAKIGGMKGERFWLNLVRGYKLCEGKVYPINAPMNPFISFVEPPDNLLTTYQVSHIEAPSTEYPLKQVREGTPTWIQNIHGGNLMNRIMRRRGERPFSTVQDQFKIDPRLHLQN